MSGAKLRSGFSVVTRHWTAMPRAEMRSCTSPTSSREAPEAMRIWAWTRSMPVTSSVTVCSTWAVRVGGGWGGVDRRAGDWLLHLGSEGGGEGGQMRVERRVGGLVDESSGGGGGGEMQRLVETRASGSADALVGWSMCSSSRLFFAHLDSQSHRPIVIFHVSKPVRAPGSEGSPR